MGKGTTYVSKQPDASGVVAYTPQEDAIWAELYARQERAVAGVACDEFVQGLKLLQLPKDRVPQLAEVNQVLHRETGWQVVNVPALIPFAEFFGLLADRKFPAATFVRTREELDYLREPDLFHELFGHAPMLTNRWFADFTHTYGRLGLAATEEDREYLARLYWFTLEFGLLRKPGQHLSIYGGGILSSIGETDYAANSPKAVRRRFDVLDVLRTPYRIDIMQPVYYVLEDLNELGELNGMDLMAKVAEAKRLGLFPPLFNPEKAAA